MPETSVQEKPIRQEAGDTEIVRQVVEFLDEKNNPWRADYRETLRECYNFKERRQWEGSDMQALAAYDIPTISVDRINRGIDTIEGIRHNTDNKKKIVPRESGDNRVADILDAAGDYVAYSGGFENPKDEAFNSLLVTGIGIRKLGYDPQMNGGEGAIWSEFCNTEDVYWSKCNKKTLEDARWIAHVHTMGWEDAIAINPQKSGEIKSLKQLLESEWEKIKGGMSSGTFTTKDYGVARTNSEGSYSFPDEVRVVELWKKKSTPISKVATVDIQIDPVRGIIPNVQVRVEAIDYQPQGNEMLLSQTVLDEWFQYVVIDGSGKNGVIVRHDKWKYPFHPFAAMCGERKKSGAPEGFVEKVIDHQKRINIAWAQKTAFNNKSIKTPMVTHNVTIRQLRP